MGISWHWYDGSWRTQEKTHDVKEVLLHFASSLATQVAQTPQTILFLHVFPHVEEKFGASKECSFGRPREIGVLSGRLRRLWKTWTLRSSCK